MSQLGLILQESLRREREARTILWFLREHMDGVDGARGRRTLKERLGLKSISCCGAAWGFRATAIRERDSGQENDDDVYGEQQNQEQQRQPQEPEAINTVQLPSNNNPIPECGDPVPYGSGMNLAAALAAERQLRASNETTAGESVGVVSNNGSGTGRGGTAPGTPLRVSLMRLLQDADGGDSRGKECGGGGRGEERSDSVCCVCIGREKGAAFIPCGHTFCRVCSRELWLNRGSCPLCNRLILEILDIY